MKKIHLFFILVGVCFIANAQQPSSPKHVPLQRVKVLITSTTSFCGGARLADDHEVLQQLQNPKPYANKVFYLRRGATNSTRKAIRVVTDSNGCFQIKLKPGNYCLLYETQLHKPDTGKFKSNSSYEFTGVECLYNWWQRGFQTLKVGNKSTTLSFNIHFPCFMNPIEQPCMEYIGPFPP
jgi:hypothetical protein